jgi:hypothetical protein
MSLVRLIGHCVGIGSLRRVRGTSLSAEGLVNEGAGVGRRLLTSRDFEDFEGVAVSS